MQREGDIDNYRYSAPETQFPGGYIGDIAPYTCERDMYGLGMITYEASSHLPWSISNLTLLQVLTGSVPYSGCDDDTALSNIKAGKTPERPSEGIPDPIWQLLEECWSKDPTKRPSAAEFYGALSGFRSIHPGRLKFKVQTIKVPFTRAKNQQFSVKFKYGNKSHTTAPTTRTAAGDEYTWFVSRPSYPRCCC